MSGTLLSLVNILDVANRQLFSHVHQLLQFFKCIINHLFILNSFLGISLAQKIHSLILLCHYFVLVIKHIYQVLPHINIRLVFYEFQRVYMFGQLWNRYLINVRFDLFIDTFLNRWHRYVVFNRLYFFYRNISDDTLHESSEHLSVKSTQLACFNSAVSGQTTSTCCIHPSNKILPKKFRNILDLR